MDLIGYRNELQRKMDAINVLLGGTYNGNGVVARKQLGRRKVKRTMSAAGKAKIAAAARKRWRKAKAAGRNYL